MGMRAASLAEAGRIGAEALIRLAIDGIGVLFAGCEIDAYLRQFSGGQRILRQAAAPLSLTPVRLFRTDQMATGPAHAKAGAFVVGAKFIHDRRHGHDQTVPVQHRDLGAGPFDLTQGIEPEHGFTRFRESKPYLAAVVVTPNTPDQALTLQRYEGLGNRALRCSKVVRKNPGRGRIFVCPGQISQGIPLCGIETMRILKRMRKTAQPVDQ